MSVSDDAFAIAMRQTTRQRLNTRRDKPYSLKWGPDDHRLTACEIVRQNADKISISGCVMVD